MLTYFPTPYPGEWWYSVLCRYHVRSGWRNHATTRHELYGNRLLVHGRLFPGGSCAKIVDQLPHEVFSKEDILKSHTLLPYYLRFYQPEKKKSILSLLCEGRSGGVTSIELKTPEGRQGPKYCPICYHEDQGAYGEAYWHRSHQIPLMPLCPQHHCRLIQHDLPFPRLSEQFTPLAEITCSTVIEESAVPWTIPLTETLSQFLSLPFEVGPTYSYNNITTALMGLGFQNGKIQERGSLNGEKVAEACRELFGEKVKNQYFPKPAPTIFSRLEHWKLSSPERYALLAVLAGLTAEEVFGPSQQVKDPLLEKVEHCMNSGVVYQKNELAAQLGISPRQLDSVARKYKIKPFWKQCAREKEGLRVESIRIQLTAGEKGRIHEAAKSHGGGQVAVFARKLLMEAIEKLEKGDDTR